MYSHLTPYAYRTEWARGFVAKCAELGIEPEELVKSAQLANTSDAIQGAGRAMFGDSTAGQLGTIAADVGSYFIPGVGLVRSTADALSDFGNVFGKNQSMGSRAKYLASGLGNALFAGTSLFTGGSNVLGGVVKGIGGAIKGTKMLAGTGKALQAGGQGLVRGVEGIRAGAQAGKGVLGGTGRMGQFGRYMSGITQNPYAKAVVDKGGKVVQPAGAKAAPGIMNKMKYVGYGSGRQMGPMGLMMQRPMEEGQGQQFPVGVPPAAGQMFGNYGNPNQRWSNV
jgi:hypothetical protein